MAIIGTLTSNIWLFRAFFGERVIDIWWDDLLSAASNGKSLGLLLLDGVLNYIFVVQFDVLRAYAILGFVVAFVLLLPEKRQWIFIGVALTAHITLMLMPLFTADGTFMLPGLVFPGDAGDSSGQSGYWATVQANSLTVFSDLTIGTDTGSILSLGLVLFTLGAILYRHGLFEPRGARLRRWVMIIGLGIGLPLELTFFLAQDQFGLDRFLSAPFVAFGILALMAAFYQRHPIGFVGRQLSLVGRMALSCYVLQNILGRVAQQLIGHSPLSTTLDPLVGTLVMFVGIAGIVVLFANLWSRRFRKGPLEYIWDVSFRLLTRRLSDLTKHVGP